MGNTKGLFTPNDSVTTTVTLIGGTFDLFDGHCDGQNGLHTHFPYKRYVCYSDSDGIVQCEQTLNTSNKK